MSAMRGPRSILKKLFDSAVVRDFYSLLGSSIIGGLIIGVTKKVDL
jgi:hypothetical protein